DDGQPEAARPVWRRRPAERRRGPAPVARVADGDRPAVRERGARQRQDGGGEEDHPGLVDIAAGCTAAAVLGSLRRSRRPSSSRTTNQARLAIVQRAPAPSTKAPEASTELPPSTTMTLPSVADVAGRSSAARRRDSTAGGDVLRRARLLERGLGGGEPRERHAVRRAGDVVEAEPVAERDRARLAAVLAADTELELAPRRAAALDGDPHQAADAVLVEDLERVPLEDAVVQVAREELALGVVARDAERGLREVVGAEREEVRVPGDLARLHARARQLDHRPDQPRRLGRLLRPHALGQLAQPPQLLGEADKRMHDLDDRARADRARRTRDRTHLHLVDLRVDVAEATAPEAEHRVLLVQRADACAQLLVRR